jgi:hypothetical protein
METQIKKDLHQLIDNCENEMLLAEAKELLETPFSNDWWDELSDGDKSLLLKSEAEYEKGQVINHTTLMQEFKEWRKK